MTLFANINDTLIPHVFNNVDSPDTELAVSIGVKIFPIFIDATMHNILQIGSAEITKREWKFLANQVFQCPPMINKQKLGPAPKAFIKFQDVVVEPDKHVSYVGFLVNFTDIYTVHHKSHAMHKNVERIVMVESSKKNVKWEVIIYKDGSTSCNCPAWRYQGQKGCKHITKVLDTRD